jgi:hypothetical protein
MQLRGDTMPNALNLELRDSEDPSGNGEKAVQVVHIDPDSEQVVTLGVFFLTNGNNPDHLRLRSYRRAGDEGSSDLCLQDENGQMVDLKAVG